MEKDELVSSPLTRYVLDYVYLTIFCEEACFLGTKVIDLTKVFIILGLQFTKLVLKGTAHLLQISL